MIRRVPGTANDNACDVCEVPPGEDCWEGCTCDLCPRVKA